MLDTDFGTVKYPLVTLLEDVSTVQMYEPMDYFEELQTKMAKGESLLNCLMQHPPDDELGIETDENSHEDTDGLLFDLEGIHDYRRAFTY